MTRDRARAARVLLLLAVAVRPLASDEIASITGIGLDVLRPMLVELTDKGAVLARGHQHDHGQRFTYVLGDPAR